MPATHTDGGVALKLPSACGRTIDRALAAGLTAMNVTMGISGIGMGVDNFRAMIGAIHGYLSYFELEDRLVHCPQRF